MDHETHEDRDDHVDHETHEDHVDQEDHEDHVDHEDQDLSENMANCHGQVSVNILFQNYN